MAKKKAQSKNQTSSNIIVKEEAITLQDQLDENVLAKLKMTKKELVVKEKKQQEEKEAQLIFERKQSEKNKSFAELLEEYGDQGSKY
ncbi:YqkE family protein [Rummeliibacillus sp. SL167]|uniref:YqkE family protein n=1 Tax=Rummeliibacillus sp. SL167 TaxID=2579792 RepID=UPI0011B4C906|nr:YqkE family protein [Rummeliibacillus sp. SL167]